MENHRKEDQTRDARKRAPARSDGIRRRAHDPRRDAGNLRGRRDRVTIMTSTRRSVRVAVAALLLGFVLAPPAWTLDRVNLHVTGSGSPFPLIFKVGIDN